MSEDDEAPFVTLEMAEETSSVVRGLLAAVTREDHEAYKHLMRFMEQDITSQDSCAGQTSMCLLFASVSLDWLTATYALLKECDVGIDIDDMHRRLCEHFGRIYV